MTSVRPAAVAGTFYPDDPHKLAAVLDGLLAGVPDPTGPVPKAIVAPHAGYIYSGPTAAAAYARLRPVRGRISRVVLLGPVHRVPVKGLALAGASQFATPLGPVVVDPEAEEAVSHLPQVVVSPEAHAWEHSLEVHLPFLLAVLGAFRLVPLAVGDASPEQVAEVLDVLWGGPETLIVISSDLSHFLDYESCKAVDARTTAAIEALDPSPIGFDNACGRLPIAGLLTVARERRLRVETLDVRNSGDTAGTRDRVVGYGAWAFYEPDSATVRKDQRTAEAATEALIRQYGPDLLHLAASSIRYGLSHGGEQPTTDLDAMPEDLRSDGAAFVTLMQNDDLRGCIGSAAAWRPLALDVVDNACKAAFEDPRFPPLRESELQSLSLSLSILSPPDLVACRDEADLIRQIRPGIDGLMLDEGSHRGLFLPSVWDALPEPAEFLAHLKRKAGLPRGYWSRDLRVRRFTTKSISSADLPDPSALWQDR